MVSIDDQISAFSDLKLKLGDTESVEVRRGYGFAGRANIRCHFQHWLQRRKRQNITYQGLRPSKGMALDRVTILYM